jgi:hypothetical protein
MFTTIPRDVVVDILVVAVYIVGSDNFAKPSQQARGLRWAR